MRCPGVGSEHDGCAVFDAVGGNASGCFYAAQFWPLFFKMIVALSDGRAVDVSASLFTARESGASRSGGGSTDEMYKKLSWHL